MVIEKGAYYAVRFTQPAAYYIGRPLNYTRRGELCDEITEGPQM